ncbi:Mov34/MPN/PAD-1 family protein [Desulfatibacillum alkenivorans]|nr:Mov34/MPN/PAD-1 family protein [Desulfatibacillum alkenivorans]
MHHEWRTDCGAYGMSITKNVWDSIKRECIKSINNEIGGILIGYYTNENRIAVVCEATPPPKDSQQGRTWFWRGITGLRSLLLERWDQKQRTYYVGEWHYHPAKVIEPSIADLRQMESISRSKRYYCNEPILIIVGKEGKTDTPVRAFVFPRDQKRIEFGKV